MNNHTSTILESWKAWVPFFIAIITILSAIWGNYKNEQDKRAHEDYMRKEQKYSKLIYSLKGFYRNTDKPELKEQFIAELNQCYLYCSDDVIRKANDFLKSVHTEADDSERNKKVPYYYYKELILTIRKDLISRALLKTSNLTANDIFLFTPS